MRKAPIYLLLILLIFGVVGCRKETNSTAAPTATPTATPGAAKPKSGPSAIMTTQFPGPDRLVLAWSLLGLQHARLEMGGQTMNVNTDQWQMKVKLTLTKAPDPDQIHVEIETSASLNGKSSSTINRMNIGGAPKGNDGKLLPFGSLMTPEITKTQTLEVGQEVVLAKGTDAFPSLTVETSG